jgi:5-deoxy-D-glucuronate isomerase
VALPWGHHPAVAGGGYRLFFVWSMVRSDEEGGVAVDPQHAWMEAD